MEDTFVVFQIDLKHADPERVENQIEKLFDIPIDECVRVRSLKVLEHL